MNWAVLILALVTLQRLGELVLAQRNTGRLLARGGIEVAAGHYPLLVVLHGAWLLGLWFFASTGAINLFWLAVFVALQGVRVWVIATLGQRWTTRIIVVPGEARIRRGPYRFVDHPNYLVVIGEIAALPLAFGLVDFAIVFSILNALALFIRIRAESQALASVES